MFTGIVEKVSKVLKAEKNKGSLFLWIKTPANWRLREGDSVLVDGVCLTVNKSRKTSFLLELMPETLRNTIFGKKVPKRVNLERPLTPASFIGGHIVLGHVDAVGKIVKMDKENYFFSFPKKYSRLIVKKGAVAIDGISLTVVERNRGLLSAALLGYTLQNTTLGQKKVGDKVNIEFDIFAKYLVG